MLDKDVLEEVKLISSRFNIKVFFKVYLPMIMPYIISSILNCFGLGLKVLVMSDLLSINENSIGYEILFSKSSLDITRIFSWSIILIIIDLLVEELIKFIDKKVLKKV